MILIPRNKLTDNKCIKYQFPVADDIKEHYEAKYRLNV